jgi:ABC-type amino acid transport substrate-binding protein
MATWAIALLATAPAAFGQAEKKAPAPAANPQAGTLDRIRARGSLKLGYRTDARPFSFQDDSGNAVGYSVELCKRVAESVKSELNLFALKVEWVPVTVDNRFSSVQQGAIDVLCGSETVTLKRRKQVAFSTPIFPGGVGVLLRSDASPRLRSILSGHPEDTRPMWRGVALNILREQIFATVAGTTAEQWVKVRSKELQVESRMAAVPSYDAGIQAVLDRKANALFAERAILLSVVRHHPESGSLEVLDRQFTFEPLALAIAPGDEDFRLLVDRTLSRAYDDPGFGDMYAKWFGKPDAGAITFFRWSALPE